MQKLAIVFAALICLGISMPAYAQEDVVIDPPIGISNDRDDPWQDSSLITTTPTGGAGRGTLESPDMYWATNSYPANISFAYNSGREGSGDRTGTQWWVIGIVDTDDTSRQEILDLLSANYYVTFIDCTYSYQQREAVYNEIYTNRDNNVHSVQMSPNSEAILVEVAAGYEEEYTRKYAALYGPLVMVAYASNASPLVPPSIDVDSSMGAASIPEQIITDNTEAVMAPGFPRGTELIPGGNNSAFGYWPWTIALLLLIGAAAVVYFNRTHLIPAQQTSSGHVVTRTTRINRKQTAMAVKNSALTPPDTAFGSIMAKIDVTKQDSEQGS